MLKKTPETCGLRGMRRSRVNTPRHRANSLKLKVTSKIKCWQSGMKKSSSAPLIGRLKFSPLRIGNSKCKLTTHWLTKRTLIVNSIPRKKS